MPKGMSKLKNLQFLSDYVVGKREENKITELGALANLHESISIVKLENVVNSGEALEARMSDKDGIDSITLTWSLNEEENRVDSEMERDILDKLRPHANLKELHINDSLNILAKSNIKVAAVSGRSRNPFRGDDRATSMSSVHHVCKRVHRSSNVYITSSFA
ncbi:hypothetical protein AHAS_Ahas02G0259500 [Arachis hypogaea]